MLVNVKNRDRSILLHQGPCLTCGAPDLPYGDGDGRGLSGPHLQYGDQWLRQTAWILKQRPKPFVFCEHNDRTFPETGMVVQFGSRKSIRVNGVAYRCIKPYLCSSCREELEQAFSELWQRQCEREEAERQAKIYEETWRRPERDEFPIEQGEWRLGLVAPTLELRGIRFQWRTSKLFCHGSSPAFVMMMTANDSLAGKCYREYDPAGSDKMQPILNLEPSDDERTGYKGLPAYEWHEEIDAREIAAASLFARWIQNHLQEDLRTNDAFVWDPRNPREYSSYGVRHAHVVKTEWIDGSIYAALCDYCKFSEIAALLEKMGYRLMLDRSNRKTKKAARS